MPEKRTQERTCVDCGKTRTVALNGHPPAERCAACHRKREMQRMMNARKR